MTESPICGKPIIRKIVATDPLIQKVDLPVSEKSETDGLRKSGRIKNARTSVVFPTSRMQSPQELMQRSDSMASLRGRLKLVSTDGPGTQSHAADSGHGVARRADLTAQVEPFSRIAGELPPLFLRHWEELALNRDTIPLDPDWDRMFMLEAQGMLHVTTARLPQGNLVGYIFNIIGRHLHYRGTVFADIDMFWLDPAYRGGWFAIRWFGENQKLLDRLEVKKHHVSIKNHYLSGRVGSVFRRLGYRPIETVFAK